MREPLVKFRLFPLVSGTDTTLTKKITKKRELSERTSGKIPVVIRTKKKREKELSGVTPRKIPVIPFS